MSYQIQNFNVNDTSAYLTGIDLRSSYENAVSEQPASSKSINKRINDVETNSLYSLSNIWKKRTLKEEHINDYIEYVDSIYSIENRKITSNYTNYNVYEYNVSNLQNKILHISTILAGTIEAFVFLDEYDEYINDYFCYPDIHKTKGFALQYLVECIRRDYGIESYDGYFIFDADNILTKNYVTKMNEAFDAGNKIITAYNLQENHNNKFRKLWSL